MSVDVITLVARLGESYCGNDGPPTEQMNSRLPPTLRHLWRLAWMQHRFGRDAPARTADASERQADAARRNVCSPGSAIVALERAVASSAVLRPADAEAACTEVCRELRHGQVIYGTGLALSLIHI